MSNDLNLQNTLNSNQLVSGMSQNDNSELEAYITRNIVSGQYSQDTGTTRNSPGRKFK